MTKTQRKWLERLAADAEHLPKPWPTKPWPTIAALGRGGYIDDANKLYWWNGPRYVITEKGWAALEATQDSGPRYVITEKGRAALEATQDS